LVEKSGPNDGQEGAVILGADGKKVTKKDVRRGIRSVNATVGEGQGDQEMEDVVDENGKEGQEEEFVHHPSKNVEEGSSSTNDAPLPTYTSLLANSASTSEGSSSSNLLFSPFTFFLSRETSARTWEFVVRAFGGKVLSLPSLESASPSELDSITHVIIDRPTEENKMISIQGDRKWTWIQPQWVADCVNQRKLLPGGKGSGYEPGGVLPPHLSPWDGEGGVDRPWLKSDGAAASLAIEGDDQEAIDQDGDAAMEDAEIAAAAQESEDDDDEEETVKKIEPTFPPALLAAAKNPSDSTLLHQAELEAESLGTDHSAFMKQLAEAKKLNAGSTSEKVAKAQIKAKDEDQRKIMMSSKKQKLYEKMKYSNNEKKMEVSGVLLNLIIHLFVIPGSLTTFFVSFSVNRRTNWHPSVKPSKRGRRRKLEVEKLDLGSLLFFVAKAL